MIKRNWKLFNILTIFFQNIHHIFRKCHWNSGKAGEFERIQVTWVILVQKPKPNPYNNQSVNVLRFLCQHWQTESVKPEESRWGFGWYIHIPPDTTSIASARISINLPTYKARQQAVLRRLQSGGDTEDQNYRFNKIILMASRLQYLQCVSNGDTAVWL